MAAAYDIRSPSTADLSPNRPSGDPQDTAAGSSKPPLAKLATNMRSSTTPINAEEIGGYASLSSAAQMLARPSDAEVTGRVPPGRAAYASTSYEIRKTDIYSSIGLGRPSAFAPDSPTSPSRSEASGGADEIPHSQPIQIGARPSVENQPEASIPLSPAMQFLNIMNSPMNTSASPALSRVTSLSVPPSEPERIGPYTLGPVIASGGFSVIRKGTSSTGVVAVKIISTSSSSPESPSMALLDQEISIWSSLHHENILPLFSPYRLPHAVYLVTLFCPSGSLLDVLRHQGSPGLPLDDAGTMFRQIVRGLKYLHEEAKIVHGDIKLENILLDEMGVCRIGDFGLAKLIPTGGDEATRRDTQARESARNLEPLTRSFSLSPSPSSLPPHLRGRRPARRGSSYVPTTSPVDTAPIFAPGSLPYAAPELLVQRASRAQQIQTQFVPNPAQDIWALGCVLHALLYGRLPFIDTYEPRLVDKILGGRWRRSPSGSRSKSRSRTRSAAGGYWGTGQRSRSRGGSRLARKKDGVKVGTGAKRVLKGCLTVDVEKRWNITQIHEVSWNVGWGEHDMEENEIILEPLSSQGLPPSPPSPDSLHSPSPSEEEQEDEVTNDTGGWETVDEKEESQLPPGMKKIRFATLQMPGPPALTSSPSPTTRKQPARSPLRSYVNEKTSECASGSPRRANELDEREEHGPMTPTDDDEGHFKHLHNRKIRNSSIGRNREW